MRHSQTTSTPNLLTLAGVLTFGRLFISGAVLAVTLHALPAAASTWTALSTAAAYREGYTSVPPTSWAPVNLLGRWVGSSFDQETSVTSGVWAGGGFTDANGFVYVKGASSGAQFFESEAHTFTTGQDFGYVWSYSHYADTYLSGNSDGQIPMTEVNDANYLTAVSYRQALVKSGEVSPSWGLYALPTFDSASVFTSRPAGAPAGRYRSTRSFVVVLGKWNEAANAWRVRSKLIYYDGTLRNSAAKESTVGAVGGAVKINTRQGVLTNGYKCYAATHTDGTPIIKRDTTQGLIVQNLESVQGAYTTSSTVVAALWDKALPYSALDGAPAEIGVGVSPNAGADDTSGLGELWSELFDKLAELLLPVQDWFAPVRLIDSEQILKSPDDVGSW